MRNSIFFLTPFLLFILLSSCDTTRRLEKQRLREREKMLQDSIKVLENFQAQLDSLFQRNTSALSEGTENGIYQSEKFPYRPVPTHYNDILHTKLALKFDWKLRHVIGTAEIKAKPYFYATDTLALDAKAFDFNEVSLILPNGNKKALQYKYDQNVIKIALDKQYTRKDTYNIYIDYVAKPYERAEGGGSAVTSDRGLFFINHDNSKPDVPQQIWTQGETSFNSCWFPTFDHPSEKMTQEIALTLEDRFLTVSNGRKTQTVSNNDGTHTDYWLQDKPHPVYLTALAIGEFGEYKDTWRGKEVNYYLEKKYAPYAKNIFGNTPEMLEFFSQKLGVDYPWDKYSQIVVREFVSGAMENTTCTIFFDDMNQDDRSLLDSDHEDIIAHELFHHWFGDLVTCESYANLALNESFATYSEYLWFEHKYGKDAADKQLANDLGSYLMEASYKKAPIIRYYYQDADDLFDNHSYQKGGCVLHILRNHVGDDAFFTALHNYLVKYAYQNTELANLRMEFEAVTGEDLNWFFNQWFLSPGHPELAFSYQKEGNELRLHVEQVQEGMPEVPVFRLHLKAQITDEKGNIQFVPIHILSADTTFSIPFSAEVKNIVLDSDGILLGSIEEKNEINTASMMAQYRNSKSYRPRNNAIEYLTANYSKEGEDVLFEALKDPFWHVRYNALSGFDLVNSTKTREITEKALEMTKDEKADVRTAALYVLGSKQAENFKSDMLLSTKIKECLATAINDRSYAAQNNALMAADIWNPALIDEFAAKLTGKEESNTIFTIIRILGERKNLAAIEKAMQIIRNLSALNDRFYAVHTSLQEFFGQNKKDVQDYIVQSWMQIAENDENKSVRMGALDALYSNKDRAEVKAFFQKDHPQETDAEIQKVYKALQEKMRP